MKQSSLDSYIEHLKLWDKSHRLIGAISPSLLVDQSLEAFKDSFLDSPNTSFVDVGAGSGIVGIPLLLTFNHLKVVFVEPDLKKSSFMLSFLSGTQLIKSKRALVISDLLQNVSCETLEKFFETNQITLLTRAFSGPKSLNDAYKDSSLSKYPLYDFNKQLTPLKSEKFTFSLLQ
jgi:hypothetical protein